MCHARSGGTTPRPWRRQIFSGRQRRLHDRYQALASHYVFDPLFCMPASGNEKPYVENRVKTLQRRWATPVPHAKDLAEFNAYLRDCCLKDRERTSGEHAETIGQRFQRDRQRSLALPSVGLRPLRLRTGQDRQVPDGTLRPCALQRTHGAMPFKRRR